jgi:hypothetical protein
MRSLNVHLVVIVAALACTASLRGEVPAGGPIRLTMPTRMVKDKTLTLKAEILDQYGCKGRVDWRKWSLLGTVSAKRVSDGSPVPTSITIFETYYLGAGGGVPPADSIRFYNGIGSVSIYFDNPATITDGEQIEIVVTAAGKTASKVVTVLPNVPGTFRSLSGTLSGAALTWSPSDGVIHLTGDATVPAGSTLTILPGTLVMADKGSAQAGVAINVSGAVNAQGTASQPIFFFPTEGPTALQLVAGNYSSWRGIYHDGANTSVYSYVFFTGGGNGIVGSYHLYPPMLRFANSHSLTMSDCVLADCPATMILGDYGGGTFNVYRSLLARAGIGAKFGAQEAPARAHMAVTFEDTWFCRIGRGVEASNLDGDALHWDSDSAQGLTIRRCVITDIGDDAVDGSDEFYIKTYFYDSIVYDLDDKLVTYWPGDAYANNLLLFACSKGFESVNGYPTQSTLGDQHPFPQEYGGDWWSNQTIAWPGGTDPNYTCSRFHANYTLLDTSQHVGCGTGNLTADPLFVDPMTGGFKPAPGDYKSSYDYNLRPGSPALTAGPGGTRIGWLGFPRAEPCSSGAQCGPGGTYDDGNPCTTDTCELGVCVHTPVDGCIACCADNDCDYGDPCVEGACESDGICSFAPVADGTACDDGLFCTNVDHCESGACVGGGATCDDGAECTADTCDEVADACTHTPLPAGTACGDPTSSMCTAPDSCDGAGACLSNNAPNGTPCDDDLFCDGEEACQSGTCVSSGNPCAPLACDEEADTCGQCFSDAECDDGIFCNGPEHCNAQAQCEPGTAPCPGQLCSEALDACVACLSDADCDDGTFCNGPEHCNGQGQCEPGSAPCPTQLCSESLDVCVECITDDDCSDGLYCNGQETCSAGGHCLPGTAPCDDGIGCTDDACSEGTHACTHTPNNGYCPDDGQFCNGSEYCDTLLGCQHMGSPCSADEVCNETFDTCVPEGSCLLGDVSPVAGPAPNVFRWKDIADNVYQQSYMDAFSYGSPSVVVRVDYEMVSNTFQGMLEGTNLKPNFAYQMKIVTNPTAKFVAELSPAEYRTLQAVASIGRWWDMTTGQVNPPYNAAHQMQSYLLFDHFETDNFGNVTKTFYADSSFHVLFTGSGYYKPVTSVVNPAGPPPNDVAYSTPYPTAQTITVGAQNEHGTPGSTFLPAGHYEGLVFLLTEESFHQNGLGGNWASAMACEILFDIRCNVNADCNDGVDCTTDACVDHVCVFTPDNGACPEDGVFCNGEEVCDPRAGCVHAGNPCDPFICDEQADSCDGGGCTEDAQCDDGVFCNGVETCVDHVCQAGTPPTCDDGVVCTVDTCDAFTDHCTHTPDNTRCNNGQFCDGVETCDPVQDCQPGTPPNCDDGIACTVDTCDEWNDVCVHTPSNAACDDGLYCNGIETCVVAQGCLAGSAPCVDLAHCDEVNDTCVSGECTTDGACDDGAFCNGTERCVDSLCVAGTPPCDDACEHCNEALDTCQWCLFDLDGSGFIGPGDFSFFAGCFGRAYGPGEACRVCNFDGSPDGFVGPGDFAGFAGCFGGSCGTCANCWATGQRLAKVRSAPGVSVRLVPVQTSTPTDVVTVLPKAGNTFPVGALVPVEVWAQVRGPDGALAAVYAAVVSKSAPLTLVAIQPSTVLGLFAQAEVPSSAAIHPAGSARAELGGCVPLGEPAVGAAGQWARVATLTVQASWADTVRLALQPAGGGYGVALLGELGLLEPTEVDYGGCELKFVPPGPSHGQTPRPNADVHAPEVSSLERIDVNANRR